MSELQIQGIDEIEPYRGPHELEGIAFKPVGGALGVTAWGMNVLEMAPGASTYPEHDHSEDGQEEVAAGSFVRVPPGTTRSWRPGENGVKLLAIGATPGKAYEPRT